MSPPTGPQSCLNCGHPAGEYTYDLDGRAGSGCWHAEEWDKDGWPASQMCDCTDYNDGGPQGTHGW